MFLSQTRYDYVFPFRKVFVSGSGKGSLEREQFDYGRIFDNAEAVTLYRNFIQGLLRAGITLSHFAVRKWSYDLGEFQDLDNVSYDDN